MTLTHVGGFLFGLFVARALAGSTALILQPTTRKGTAT
jgi:hypothetical protein